MTTDEGKVGSKGELFPPKRIREALGFKKNQKIKYSVVRDRLIVEKIADPLMLLLRSPKVKISLKEFKKDRKILSRELET
ncbi:MAG: hypothetical protein KAT16_07565 [Candidatus Heimdallarchaeota archaeon]|nr:hypothetical protein [Candidatus Heimdallarchaeota archaeon]